MASVKWFHSAFGVLSSRAASDAEALLEDLTPREGRWHRAWGPTRVALAMAKGGDPHTAAEVARALLARVPAAAKDLSVVSTIVPALLAAAAAGYRLMVARNRKRLNEFSDGPPTSAPANKRSGTQSLSQRELELLALLAEGQTDQQIATTLSISLRTVRSYLDRIRDKTGCRRRPELTWLAVELGLLAGNL